jgi:hypothetical protein
MPPGKLSLYACGDVHLRFPTGGTANGTEMNALAPLGHVVPTTVPDGSSAVGDAPTKANEAAAMERVPRNESMIQEEKNKFQFSKYGE